MNPTRRNMNVNVCILASTVATTENRACAKHEHD